MKAILITAAGAALLLTAACASDEVVGYTRHGKPVACNEDTGDCYVVRGHRYTAYGEPWSAPAGYVDQDWDVGATIPQTYWGAEIEWRSHNLYDPGPGRRWIRVNHAAVLIDADGHVIERVKHVYK